MVSFNFASASQTLGHDIICNVLHRVGTPPSTAHTIRLLHAEPKASINLGGVAPSTL
jgi:hypothetical protein